MKSLAVLIHRRTSWVVLLPMGLLCLALLLGAFIQAIWYATRRAESAGAAHAHMIARVLEMKRSDWSVRLRHLQEMDGPTSYYDLWSNRFPEFCILSIWDSTGTMEVSWPRRDVVPPPRVVANAWTGVEAHPRCDGPVIRARIPLDSGRRGVVTLSLDRLSPQVEPFRESEGGSRMVVVDTTGAPVFDWSGKNTKKSDPQGWLSSSTGVSRGVYRSGSKIIAWAAQAVPGTPWLLVFRIEAGDIAVYLLPILVFVALVFASVASLSLWMSKSVTRVVAGPLSQLSGSIRELEEERWEGTLPPSDLREIEDLSRAFERMATRVAERERERRVELEERSEKLEERGRQLENALREMESFSYSVSHDLRAPLRAIAGFSQVLDEDASERLLPEEKDALARIRRATGTMSGLIDDLLALSKASRVALSLRRVDMDAMVRELVEGFQEAEPERMVSWDVGDLGMACADPGLIHQVWANLLSNAFKFTSRKEDATIVVRAERGDSHTTWTISDNGAGFDRAAASKLFQPFRRMHDESTYPGTGIGLALVQRILERHDGAVAVDSEVGKGTRVAFTLPNGIPGKSDSGV